MFYYGTPAGKIYDFITTLLYSFYHGHCSCFYKSWMKRLKADNIWMHEAWKYKIREHWQLMALEIHVYIYTTHGAQTECWQLLEAETQVIVFYYWLNGKKSESNVVVKNIAKWEADEMAQVECMRMSWYENQMTYNTTSAAFHGMTLTIGMFRVRIVCRITIRVPIVINFIWIFHTHAVRFPAANVHRNFNGNGQHRLSFGHHL